MRFSLGLEINGLPSSISALHLYLTREIPNRSAFP
jgi:hypothetical protein